MPRNAKETKKQEPLSGLSKMLEERKQRSKVDAKRFHDLDSDLCQLCEAKGEDKRSLWIQCFYDVKEVLPEAIDLDQAVGISDDLRDFYYLRICKACRGDLLSLLGLWRNKRIERRGLPMDHDGNDDDYTPERNIPVRRNGTTVMLTREEWDAENPDREPIVYDPKA